MCPLYNPWRVGDILIWLGTHVNYHETMCRAHVWPRSFQCQGDFLKFKHTVVSALYLFNPWLNVHITLHKCCSWWGYLSLPVIALVSIVVSCKGQVKPLKPRLSTSWNSQQTLYCKGGCHLWLCYSVYMFSQYYILIKGGHSSSLWFMSPCHNRPLSVIPILGFMLFKVWTIFLIVEIRVTYFNKWGWPPPPFGTQLSAVCALIIFGL